LRLLFSFTDHCSSLAVLKESASGELKRGVDESFNVTLLVQLGGVESGVGSDLLGYVGVLGLNRWCSHDVSPLVKPAAEFVKFVFEGGVGGKIVS